MFTRYTNRSGVMPEQLGFQRFLSSTERSRHKITGPGEEHVVVVIMHQQYGENRHVVDLLQGDPEAGHVDDDEEQNDEDADGGKPDVEEIVFVPIFGAEQTPQEIGFVTDVFGLEAIGIPD
jgi:hypothetical protein